MNYEPTMLNAFRREVWSRVRGRFAHAFALCGQGDRLEENDLIFLDRFARLLADRDLATPALFLVESLAPLGFLGSQLVHALAPILEAVAPPDDIERLARLLDHRETPALFIDRLRWFDMALRPRSGQAHNSREEEAHRSEP